MKKNVGILIGLSIIAVLAIAVIIMVIIPVNYKPSINNPSRITVIDASKNYLIESENEDYDKVMKAFNDSFTQSFMSALFAGQAGGIKSVKLAQTVPSFDGYVIKYSYNTPQTLVVNGVEQTAKYTSFKFCVENDSTYANIKLYFEQANNSQYYVIETLGNTASLFKLVNEFEYK